VARDESRGLPRFSVVMAAHDSSEWIESSIRSALAQTEHDLELVVVDDGSTDDTAERVERISRDDSRVRLLRQANRGPSAARNAGLAAARGSYVSTLDSDDLWLPTYLERMAAVLERHPDAGFAYTDAWVLDTPTGRVRATTEMAYQRPPLPPPADPDAFLRELLERNFVYNSVTLRRSVLDRVSGYDERLWTGEDWELWLRIVAAGFRAIRVDETLAVHRDRAGSLSTDLRRMVEGDCEVYRIVAEEWDTRDDLRGVAFDRLARRRRALRDLAAPSPARRVVLLLRELAARGARLARRRGLWLDEPPPEVATLLRAVGAAAGPSRGTP
jgi:glycosyltransferase involved in cell wall biosynthesis